MQVWCDIMEEGRGITLMLSVKVLVWRCPLKWSFATIIYWKLYHTFLVPCTLPPKREGTSIYRIHTMHALKTASCRELS